MSPELLELERELAALDKLRAKGGAAALAMVLEARREQIEKHGHTEEADATKTPAQLADLARQYLSEARDVLEAGPRQNFAVGMRRLARGAALALAAIERTKKEASK